MNKEEMIDVLDENGLKQVRFRQEEKFIEEDYGIEL